MNRALIEFEHLDIEKLFELIKCGRLTCYEYYSKLGFDINYQEVLNNEISKKYYKKVEDTILDFIKDLGGKCDVLGVTYTFSDSMKKSFPAVKSLDYYTKMQLIESKGKLGNKVKMSADELEVTSIIAMRGIGQTLLLLKEYELLVFLSDLHGILIFYNDIYVNDVLDVAKKYPLVVSSI